MDPSVIVEASNATAERRTGWTPWEFTWGLIRWGDCMMVEGATWTLHPNGTATFDATVTSVTDCHTWTIWHVDLLDPNGSVLGSLTTEHPVEGDWRKFVWNMPSGGQRYRVRACATFDADRWNEIARLKIYSSC
jgi:hypothetical protein